MFDSLGIIGRAVIFTSFAAALFSVFSYFRAYRGNQIWLQAARYSYHTVTIGVMIATASLLILIVTHQFQYTYVWNYSSTDLPPHFLISTFYAGQEGSFMLWALYTAILGVLLMQYTAKHNYEVQVMSIFALVEGFLLLMLVVKNPFEHIWEAFPKDVIKTGPIPQGVKAIALGGGQWAQIPLEGRGLNPLLQNFWMVIHPPILFIGFASMAMPFSFALGALVKKDYQNWVKIAMPWILFPAMILGTGLILGGFWAYETLGWGGYWGWDPVENSSLIPWLTCVALVHTILTQKRTGGLIKTNLFLGIISFLLVLYSTFLTRSGVLGDSSVHSFVDPGFFAYLLLIIFISVFAVIGIGMLIVRAKDLARIGGQYHIFSRELALAIGSAVLGACALVVLAGTSWPLISKGTVDASFYNRMNLPLAIVIGLLNGLSLLLKWKQTNGQEVLKKSSFAVISAIVVTALLVLFGVRDVPIALLAFAASFAFFVNAQIAWRVLRGNPRKVGAYVAHLGLSLMLLGIIGSGRYDQKQNLELTLNQPKEAFGYQLTYIGWEQIENGDKYAFKVKVEKPDGSGFILEPVMYVSNYNNGLMRNPDIANLVTKDFYLSPQSLETQGEQSGNQQSYDFKRGDTKKIGSYTVTFTGFDFSDTQKEAMLAGSEFSIGAILEVKPYGGKVEKLTAVTTYRQGVPEYRSVKVSDGGLEFMLMRMNVNQSDVSQSTVTIGVTNPLEAEKAQGDNAHKAETLIVEASIKPFINLFWGGSIVLVLGFFISILRRAKEI